MMKRMLAIFVSIFVLMTIMSSSVFATVNTKMILPSLTKVYCYTYDPSTPPYLIFAGRISNKTKYLATINKLTMNINIASTLLNLKKTTVFDPKNLFQTSEFKSVLPKTIKGNSSVSYVVRNTEATSDLKGYNNHVFAKSEYAKTTYTVDFTITATTIKTTKIMSKASSTSKGLKTLKAKAKVYVIGLPANKFIKVKYGTITGYVLVANIK